MSVKKNDAPAGATEVNEGAAAAPAPAGTLDLRGGAPVVDAEVVTGGAEVARTGDVEGISFADSGIGLVPFLRMAYGVGGLADAFTPGDLVVCDASTRVLVAAKEVPLIGLVVTVKLGIKDRLTREEFAAKKTPRRYRSMEEAKAAGKITVNPPWESGLPLANVTQVIDLRLLIRKPDAVESDWFSIRIGDHSYALVDCSWDKQNYKACATAIISRITNLMNVQRDNKAVEEQNAKALAANPAAVPRSLLPVPAPTFFRFMAHMTKSAKGDFVPIFQSSMATDDKGVPLRLTENEALDFERQLASLAGAVAEAESATDPVQFVD